MRAYQDVSNQLSFIFMKSFSTPRTQQSKRAPAPIASFFSGYYLLISSVLLLPALLPAQSITGRIFRDFNANGAIDANEAGVGGVIVSAYDDNDPINTPTATATTNANGPALATLGTYTLTGLAAGVEYRLEFTWPTTGVGHLGFLEPGAAGGTGGTSVQFATAGAININLGISSDGQYCPPVADVKIITSCAVTGDPFATGNNLANDGILIRTNYLASGTTPAANYLATASQVGGYLHGIAKDPLSNRVFSANTLKRHASFGPDRASGANAAGKGGAIYVTNLSAALPNGAVYIDLVNDLGIDIGQALIPNNAGRGLPSTKGNASLDAAVFTQVGKMGIGDIEISDDGAYLFAVNLFDRRVYQIPTADVDNGAPYSSTLIPDFPNYAIGSGCTNGVQRPYGLAYHDGDLFLGVVCTGENNTTTNTNADLVAFVYRYDLNNSSGGGWSTAITFPLTYSKGYAYSTEAGTTQWYNWTDTYQYLNNLSQGSLISNGTFAGGGIRPQPILSDIEFDEDGSMILGFMDRTGHQLGHRNATPTDINNLITGVTSGDILRTYLNPATGAFVLENNGSAGPYTSSGTGSSQAGAGGPGSNQGPGGGEFFWRDYGNNVDPNDPAHSENSNGGIAICPGTREVVVSAYDPDDRLDSGGYIVLNDNNGSKARGYQLYFDDGFPPGSGTTGKGNGTGDIEFVIAPTPIQVGNYVWSDTDQDGVQDPGENGINGLALQLWADTDNNGSVDTKVAETTTDANGRYLFSKTGTNAFGQSENWTFYGSDNDQVEPNRAYEIRVATAQGALTGFSLTGQNTAASGAIATNNNLTDLRDSDAGTAGSNAVIAFTTGGQGENNHTLDMGFYSCIQPSGVTFSQTAPTCTGATANNNGVITFATVTGVTNFGISTVGAATYDGPAYPATTFTAVGQNVSTTIPNTGGTYIVRVFNGAAGCYKDETVTVAPVICLLCSVVASASIGDCYDDNGNTPGGNSVANLSVVVNWQNRPGTENITVSVPGGTPAMQTITVGATAGSATVNFVVPANGNTNTVTANFVTTTGCSGTANYTAPAGNCLNTPCQAGNTGGIVWQDYNNDGIQSGEPFGVAGVTVRAYDCTGTLVATATTDALGQYTFGPLAAGVFPIRVEFSGWPASYKPTSNGTDGRTDVQVIQTAECDVDMGLVSPDDYCQTEPIIAFSCFAPGDLSANAAPAIGTFPLNATMSNQIIGDVPGSTYGSVYGLAYDRVKKALYSSTFLKRHVALGGSGLGAVYKTSYAGVPSTSLLITVPNVGTIDRTGGNALPNSAATPSVDADAFGKIGKVGLGDIDISADGNTLYTINLNTRNLVVISNVMGAPSITEVPIASAPNCTNGVFRPMGVKVYQGKVYVGGVCSGENGGTASDINASVQQYDPVANTWSQVLSFDLTSPAYNHGNVVSNGDPALAQCTEWEPWVDTYSERNVVVNAGAGEPALDPTGNFEIVGGGATGAEFRCRAQAMISDIDFTRDGYMLIALMDRTGHQFGYRQHPPTGSGTGLNNGPVSSNNGGDMLIAYKSMGNWQLESNGALVSGRTSTGGVGNNQGPNGGEFFYSNLRVAHEDADAGGIAHIPGTNLLLGAILDPNTSAQSFGGGVIYYDVTTGNTMRNDLTIIDASTNVTGIGKANGIGDLEALCNPVPIQIGNYVWEDTDGDGVQDPCESGIVGVKVELYKKDGTLIGVTTTNAQGEYAFDNTNVDELDFAGTPLTGFTGLSANTQYLIVIGKNMNQYNTGTALLTIGGNTYKITPTDTGEGVTPDQNDNDGNTLTGLTAGAAALNGYVGYCATTPDQGSNHTFDFGFKKALVDFGDLPDSGPGAGPGNYETTLANGGPYHNIITGLKIGATEDAEADGVPSATANGDDLASSDDEDGFTVLPMFVAGQTTNLTIPVTNSTGINTAKLVVFIDFNNDGTFGATEMFSASNVGNVPNVNINVPVPVDAVLNTNVGLRLRFSTDPSFVANMSPNGPAADGEVEDYVVQIMGYDWGDLADGDPASNGAGNYATQNNGTPSSVNDGPSHKIVPGLKLGGTIDAESDGQQSTLATGDDSTTPPGTDDENGVTLPSFVPGVPANITVTAMNMMTPGAVAKLFVFIDWNNDGTFDDLGEAIPFVNVPDGTDINTNITVSVTPPANTVLNADLGVRVRLSTDMMAMNPNGNAADGEVEDYTTKVQVVDYGDHPISYGTTGPNAPRHTADPTLKLGIRLDGETDGQPDPMAGAMMPGGDDNNNGVVVAGTAGDDEDGVMLVSPLIPGATATIMVDAMNTTGSAAVLQGWIDWNGNGMFDMIPNEELTFTNGGGGAVPSPAGLVGAKLTFVVPSTAMFASGNAFMRFRLSPSGGLLPGSQTAPAPLGEIEDYKTSLGKLGNLVFNDQNFNGLQELGEAGINGVTVTLTWAGPDNVMDGGGDDVTYTSLTTGTGFDQGEYYFCGITNGTYKIKYTTPTNMTPTRNNQGSQANGGIKDSDGSLTGMDLTMAMETFTILDVTALPTTEDGNGDNGTTATGGFPNAQTDETHDQGFALLDYGDLPQTPPGDDFNTTMAEGGAVHVVNNNLKLGTTVDGEQDGTPSATANGDDANNTGSADDEDGIVFATPLIPGNSATITVSAMNTTGGDAVLQGWIDWNNDGILSNLEQLTFTSPAGGVIASPAGVSNAAFSFNVPPATTAIFNGGMVFARFRLSPIGSGLTADGPDKSNPASTIPQGEVEDYKLNVAKVGNYVWEDRNFDGLQGTTAAEPPLNGVSVQLVWLGADGAVGGVGANADVSYTALTTGSPGFQPGQYYYCGLTPGTYKLVYGTPTNMTPTPADQGSQTNGGVLDSDGSITGTMAMETFTIPADVTTLPTAETGRTDNGTAGVGTFPDNQTDETHDQGFALLDYGDLPDSGPGVSAGNYETQSGNNGAFHVIVPNLKIGNFVDAETNGNQNSLANGDDLNNTDDEDGFDPSLAANMLIAGQTTSVTIQVMNVTGSNAKMVAFIDFDGDGDFNGVNSATDEMVSVSNVGNVGSVMLNIPVPTNSLLNTNVGMRIRFSTDANFAANMSPNGLASDGEVEDYVVQIMGYDWGDLADGNTATNGTGNYATQNDAANPDLSNDGPSHKIVTGLRMGASVDAEANGQQSLTANGDDSTTPPGIDDENGVSFPTFTAGLSSNITVNVRNTTGSAAKLFAFIDWNNDGDFADVDETIPVVPVSDGTNGNVTVTVTPPLGFTLGIPNTALNVPLGARFRLSTDMAAMSPVGNATDGEVEDYQIIVSGYDWGDLNDTGAGTGTAPNGTPANYNTNDASAPSHKILTDPNTGVVTLKIGASVDDEATGQSSTTAGRLSGGDDAANLSDEDGLIYATMPSFIITQTTNLTIPVMNTTGSTAKLMVFVDFNKNGDFTDAGESFPASSLIPSAAGVFNASVAVMVPAPPTAAVGEYVGLRIRLANDAMEAMSPTGIANSGEVEDYEVQLVGFDFGDLPDMMYNTSGNDNPPAHLITPNLKLGASVDAEVDGAPEPMAGQMAGGDDNTAGLVTYGPVGDDENGVSFLTPLLPGSTATIQVTAMNMTGNPAVLQGWIDYDGNGMFDLPAEALVFTNIGGGNVPSPAGLTNANLTFDVPVGAKFAPNGAAFVRFRLSPSGGLFPSSQTAPVPLGEIEDYKVSVGKVGNLVFEDYNFNGLQDAGEPGIAGATVTLTWLGADGAVGGSGLNADVTYPVVQTGSGAQQGKYYFCGLTDGPGANDNQFKLTFATPTNMTPTRTDEGGQASGGIKDSDGSTTGMDLSMTMETFAFSFPTPTTENGTGDSGAPGVGNFPDNVTDETHDQGFASLDYGDLPPIYKTTMADNGPIHVIVPGLKLGGGVDGEQDATILPDGLATGDDVTGIDDEDGIVFPPLLVLAPGGSFTINVNAMNSTGASAVLQGWIDWNSNGVLEPTEALTLPLVPNGGLNNVPVNIVVPANADFNMCMMYARFRLSPAGNLTPDGPAKFGAMPVPQGEVEDHKKPIDIKPPTIICPANIVRNTDLNQCTAVVSYALPMATDDCSSVTLMLTGGLPSGAAFPKGVTMVNWKVTDAVGYMAVCGFTVTVNDMQNPAVSCPANISLPTDLNQCSAAVIYPTPIFSDNCPAPTLALTSGAGTASGSTFSKGTTTVSYKVTDSSGNMSVCNFTVTVSDLQKPNIMCPVSVTKSTDPNLCNAVVTYGAAMATDNCTPPPTVTVIGGLPSGSSFPKGVTTVTLKATDGVGLTRTCTLRVTVNDTQAPALTCPTNIVKSTELDLCTAVAAYTLPAATDNCMPAPAVVRISGPASGSPFPQGVNTVVLKATDGSGNTKTCTFTVTVNDTQLPDIICPPNVVKNTDLNQCSAVVAYPNPAATDNCHGMPGCPTVSLILLNGLTSNSVFPIGETTVVWKAADASGNTRTCSFKVTVNDTQAPMVMCPNNITVAGSGSPCGFPSANLFPGTVMMENCPNGLTLTSNAPTTLPAGATTITWTAKDGANNASNCMYVVTVTCTVTPWGKGGVSAREEDGTQTLMGPGLLIAPNPTTGRTVLRLDGVGEKGGELMVMDPLGRIVWRQNVGARQTEALLDVVEAKLASGVYQVRLRTEQGMVTKGLVVNQ